jgi:hypothetical protein
MGIFVVSQWPDQRLITHPDNQQRFGAHFWYPYDNWCIPACGTRSCSEWGARAWGKLMQRAVLNTHTLSILTFSEVFSASIIVCWYCQRCTCKLCFSNCQLCHELLVCLLCLISLIKRLQNSQVHNWLLLSTQLPIVPTTMTHTAEIFFFSVIIVCNTRCTTKCLSFPTCAKSNSTTQVHLLYGLAHSGSSLTHSLVQCHSLLVSF